MQGNRLRKQSIVTNDGEGIIERPGTTLAFTGERIYSLEHWGLLRCTATYFAITLTAYCAVGFTLGWLDLRDPATPFMFLGYVIAYLIIWLVMYLKCKRQIRQINEALKTWKAHQDEDK